MLTLICLGKANLKVGFLYTSSYYLGPRAFAQRFERRMLRLTQPCLLVVLANPQRHPTGTMGTTPLHISNSPSLPFLSGILS